MSHPIYCLSFQNPVREKRMTELFERLGFKPFFCKGVERDDTRILGRPIDDGTIRTWSTCYGHLDMIEQFIKSEEEIGIFCEDDLLVRLDFAKHLQRIIHDFKNLNLDILLLGFLCDNDIRRYSNFPEKVSYSDAEFPFRYYDYCIKPESGVWGAQMYMLTREHAIELYERYAYGYADLTIMNSQMTPFSSDWILTKSANNRALIYPLMVIEDGRSTHTDLGQDQTRTRCFDFWYKEELFGPI
jgi:GR25 family glycosyltransferase involved in LPS biosynthesis